MTTGALTSVATGEEDNAIVEALRTTLRGEVIDRSHPAYDNARRVWNGLIDRFPAVIARCNSTADVVEAVRIARKHRPLVSIRGGGHQVAGSAVLRRRTRDRPLGNESRACRSGCPHGPRPSGRNLG
jgi:hypothetical protein